MWPLINETNKQTIKEQKSQTAFVFSKTTNLKVMNYIKYALKSKIKFVPCSNRGFRDFIDRNISYVYIKNVK